MHTATSTVHFENSLNILEENMPVIWLIFVALAAKIDLINFLAQVSISNDNYYF